MSGITERSSQRWHPHFVWSKQQEAWRVSPRQGPDRSVRRRWSFPSTTRQGPWRNCQAAGRNPPVVSSSRSNLCEACRKKRRSRVLRVSISLASPRQALRRIRAQEPAGSCAALRRHRSSYEAQRPEATAHTQRYYLEETDGDVSLSEALANQHTQRNTPLSIQLRHPQHSDQPELFESLTQHQLPLGTLIEKSEDE